MFLKIRNNLIGHNQPRRMPSLNLFRLDLCAPSARPIHQNLLNSHRNSAIFLTQQESSRDIHIRRPGSRSSLSGTGMRPKQFRPIRAIRNIMEKEGMRITRRESVCFFL